MTLAAECYEGKLIGKLIGVQAWSRHVEWRSSAIKSCDDAARCGGLRCRRWGRPRGPGRPRGDPVRKRCRPPETALAALGFFRSGRRLPRIGPSIRSAMRKPAMRVQPRSHVEAAGGGVRHKGPLGPRKAVELPISRDGAASADSGGQVCSLRSASPSAPGVDTGADLDGPSSNFGQHLPKLARGVSESDRN